jgi:hypothetical protein
LTTEPITGANFQALRRLRRRHGCNCQYKRTPLTASVAGPLDLIQIVPITEAWGAFNTGDSDNSTDCRKQIA